MSVYHAEAAGQSAPVGPRDSASSNPFFLASREVDALRPPKINYNYGLGLRQVRCRRLTLGAAIPSIRLKERGFAEDAGARGLTFCRHIDCTRFLGIQVAG